LAFGLRAVAWMCAAWLCAAPWSAARAEAPAAAAALPSAADLVYRTTAQFELAGFPLKMSARTTTNWRRSGDSYEAHLHIEIADFDQLSEGTIGRDESLSPRRYTEKRPFHSPETVSVDWAGGTIRFGDAAPAAAPTGGAQDRLSLQFELVRLRLRHPEGFPAGSAHDVRLIGTHDVDPWTFTVGPEEAIETGAGTQRAVRYSARRMAGGVEETMDIWLGADLHWMPIRIRMVDRHHSVIDSVLQSVAIS
jgi:hypothetical protein